MTIRFGLIGAGSMGSLHARVISGTDGCSLRWIADPLLESARRVSTSYGGDAISEPDLSVVDAVVVAAPTEHHHRIAMEVIAAGRPLLVEKPLADSLPHCEAIVAAAADRGVPLMCGLLERFNPAVRTAFEIAAEPVHAAAVRHSPFVDRIRTGVASDLLIHDVDLALRLFGGEPVNVKAVASHAHPRSEAWSEDAVSALLEMPSGGVVELSASRLSQRKVRTLTITEVDRLIEVDLVRQDITIHRHLGLETAEVDGLGYRQQSIMEVPVIRHQGEPLALQLRRFLGMLDGSVDIADERSTILPPHRVIESVKASAR